MNKSMLTGVFILFMALPLRAACPLDHFLIGCNSDGITGTQDDYQLFVDAYQKYRHSDPAHQGDPTWLHGYYPMYYSQIYHDYYIGEPGFDLNSDPNHAFSGVKNVDYRIMVKCIAIRPGLRVMKDNPGGFTLDEPNDAFNHSGYADPHIHAKYRAPSNDRMWWVVFQLSDALGPYQPSDPFGIAFVCDPLPGDLWLDNKVDAMDLIAFSNYWLADLSSHHNDYYERADVNRDGAVDLRDFSLLASHWLEVQTP